MTSPLLQARPRTLEDALRAAEDDIVRSSAKAEGVYAQALKKHYDRKQHLSTYFTSPEQRALLSVACELPDEPEITWRVVKELVRLARWHRSTPLGRVTAVLTLRRLARIELILLAEQKRGRKAA